MRRVELRVAAEHVEDARCALQQAGELRVELADRVRLVRAEVGDGALDAGPVAGPGLGGAVARLDEERVRRPAVGAQHRDRVRVVEARQVVEVAVLAERELGVGGARDEARALDEATAPGPMRSRKRWRRSAYTRAQDNGAFRSRGGPRRRPRPRRNASRRRASRRACPCSRARRPACAAARDPGRRRPGSPRGSARSSASRPRARPARPGSPARSRASPSKASSSGTKRSRGVAPAGRRTRRRRRPSDASAR